MPKNVKILFRVSEMWFMPNFDTKKNYSNRINKLAHLNGGDMQLVPMSEH